MIKIKKNIQHRIPDEIITNTTFWNNLVFSYYRIVVKRENPTKVLQDYPKFDNAMEFLCKEKGLIEEDEQ